jgi:uncharacterized protein (UPF0303 family)
MVAMNDGWYKRMMKVFQLSKHSSIGEGVELGEERSKGEQKLTINSKLL